jgi:hypothetical protein
MDKPLEKLWVSFVDSAQFRNFARRGIGHSFFRSGAYRFLRLAKNNLSSSVASIMKPTQFQDVKTFCLFVGHNKSGTSMLGSLLDAHPNVILADEIGALEHVAAGFKRDQIFHLLLRGSRRELMKGRVTARRLTPYSYLVPGQWQGRFTRLQVVGDGKAGSSTQHFAQNPHLLARLQSVMTGIDVKLIQVIRNPFDVISVMMVRGKRTFANSIYYYFASCSSLLRLRQQIGAARLHAVRYEDFVLQPQENLAGLCNFLGLEPHAEYLQACAGIIHEKPDRSRQMVEWTPEWIKVVEDNLARYEFLQGYSFES